MGKNKKRKTVEYGKYGYFFIAPFFIVYLFFQFWPLINTFFYSTQNYYKRNGREFMEFYGMTNFLNLLGITAGERAYILTYLGNTLIMWVVNFIPQLIVSLLLAAWLTDTKVKLKGTGAYKVLIYLPSVITAASISVLFKALFSQYGPVTMTLKNIGLVAKNFDFMQTIGGTRGIISFILFWMWFGNTSLLLISGVLGVDPSLYEAADIDGAKSSQKFFRITLPLLKPIMMYVLITSAIGGIQMYDIPALFNITENGLIGMPDDHSTTMAMYVMRVYASDTGKAATISVFMFILTLVISMVFFCTLGKDSTGEKLVKSRKQKGGKA